MKSCIKGYPLDIHREVVDVPRLYDAIKRQLTRPEGFISWYNLSKPVPHTLGLNAHFDNEGVCVEIVIYDQNYPGTLLDAEEFELGKGKSKRTITNDFRVSALSAVKYLNVGSVVHVGTMEDAILVKLGFGASKHNGKAVRAKVRQHLSGPHKSIQEIVCGDWAQLVGYTTDFTVYQQRAFQLIKWLTTAPDLFDGWIYQSRSRRYPEGRPQRMTLAQQ